MDFDAEGLARWAKGHFSLEMNPEEIRARASAAARPCKTCFSRPASERIDSVNLDGLAKFAEKTYGAEELVKWADQKFGITIKLE